MISQNFDFLLSAHVRFTHRINCFCRTLIFYIFSGIKHYSHRARLVLSAVAHLLLPSVLRELEPCLPQRKPRKIIKERNHGMYLLKTNYRSSNYKNSSVVHSKIFRHVKIIIFFFVRALLENLYIAITNFHIEHCSLMLRF